MKIDLSNIALTANIDPFEWDMSWKEIQTLIPEWEKEIQEVLKHKEGYINIDAVEFYFDGYELNELNEIIINVWKINENYTSKYFDNGWLNSNLNYEKIKSTFLTKNVSYEETKGPNFGIPIFLPNRQIIFGFYEDLEINKILIRKLKFDNNFLNGNKYEVIKTN